MGNIPEEELELPSCACDVTVQRLDGVRVWVRVYFNCGAKPLELATTHLNAQKGTGPVPKGGPRLTAKTSLDILRGKLSNSTKAVQVHRSDGRLSQIPSLPTQARTQARPHTAAHVHQKNSS